MYSLQSSMPFTGTTKLDGLLEYDAEVKDFSWPAEVGVGLAPASWGYYFIAVFGAP